MTLSPLEHRQRYGPAHRKRRQAWVTHVATGTVKCARCGGTIEPWQPWDLGHAPDGVNYSGPEHTKCNRRTSAHDAPKRLSPSRVW